TFFGAGMIAMPFVTNPAGGESGASAWSHRVDPPGVELTLPSHRWRKSDKPGEVAFFASRNPQMVAGIKDVPPATSAAQFEAMINSMKQLAARSVVTTIEERREPNASGHEHWRFVGEENTPNGRIAVGMSATWWNKTHVVVMVFEGQYRMASQ